MGGVADRSRLGFMQESKDAVEVRGSFQKTASRKTAENTVKHRNGGVGSVVANHRGGGESSVVVTTLRGAIVFVAIDTMQQLISIH